MQFEDCYVNPELLPEFLEQGFGEHLQPAKFLLEASSSIKWNMLSQPVIPAAMRAKPFRSMAIGLAWCS